jgi:protein arginine N-methyltransferase 1
MIEFQRLILGDRVRNEALVAALKKAVVPGATTVADLGSGTGFLAFTASRLGAKRCWLVEVSELVELSREIARDNQIGNCTFVRAHSTEIAEPPQVDLVISETLGNLALEEGVLETLQDARRFLKPGGTMIPQKLRQLVAPVTSSRLMLELDVWPRELDLAAARRVAANNVYVRRVAPSELLEDGVSCREWDAIDFRRKERSVRRATVEWKLARPTPLHGFALWWECELLEGEPAARLSTAPDAPPTHWEQVWLPPPPAAPGQPAELEAKAGETLRLALECDSRREVKINLRWTTTLLDRAGKPRFEAKQDMQQGHLE